MGMLKAAWVGEDTSAAEQHLPLGFMTVPEWWSTNEPDTVELLADPTETFKRDEASLVKLALQRGIRMEARDGVIAFPGFLLAEFYPLSP